MVPRSLPFEVCRLFPAICYAQCMVSDPQLTVGNAQPMAGDPQLEARNPESKHLRAVSQNSLSGQFQSNLSGPSPVQNQRTDLSASEQVVTKAQGFSFSAPFLLPVLGSLPHLLTSSPNQFFTRSLIHFFTRSLLHSLLCSIGPLFPVFQPLTSTHQPLLLPTPTPFSRPTPPTISYPPPMPFCETVKL